MSWFTEVAPSPDPERQPWRRTGDPGCRRPGPAPAGELSQIAEPQPTADRRRRCPRLRRERAGPDRRRGAAGCRRARPGRPAPPHPAAPAGARPWTGWPGRCARRSTRRADGGRRRLTRRVALLAEAIGCAAAAEPAAAAPAAPDDRRRHAGRACRLSQPLRLVAGSCRRRRSCGPLLPEIAAAGRLRRQHRAQADPALAGRCASGCCGRAAGWSTTPRPSPLGSASSWPRRMRRDAPADPLPSNSR